jgi:carboxymethylenebutenolidase
MDDETRTLVDVETDAGAMPGHLWSSQEGTGPGILLLQEIFGVSPYIARRGAALARAGYVVLAPELYWRTDAPPLDESAPDVVETAMGRAMGLDWETTVADAVAALDHLRARPEVDGPVGVLGFCFGGGLGFNVAAVADVDFLVSYYGSQLPGLLELAPRVSAPSLHHFGLADDFIDAETVARIRAAVTAGDGETTFETYEGANHAFDNDDFYYYDPEASALAWRRTLEFVDRHSSR